MMTLEKYRSLCFKCLKPLSTCYCKQLRPFVSFPRFVILIHPSEVRRRIATGRMAHHCLSNSLFFAGVDFSQHESVNNLIEDSQNQCFVLFPAPEALDLTRISPEERLGLCPPGKTPTVFVLDGTWSQAKKMKRLSQNLRSLPKICFTPPSPSNFRVRKQPHPQCYSTIEAIHLIIELFGQNEKENRRHNLLQVFDHMVEEQLKRCPADFQKRMML